MSVYYEERKGLITQTISLSLEELLNSFIQGYHYFNRKGSFELAFKGANHEDRWTHELSAITTNDGIHLLIYFYRVFAG